MKKITFFTMLASLLLFAGCFESNAVFSVSPTRQVRFAKMTVLMATVSPPTSMTTADTSTLVVATLQRLVITSLISLRWATILLLIRGLAGAR